MRNGIRNLKDTRNFQSIKFLTKTWMFKDLRKSISLSGFIEWLRDLLECCMQVQWHIFGTEDTSKNE